MRNVQEFLSRKSIPDDFNGMVSLPSKYHDDEESIIYDCKNGVLTEIPVYDDINDTPKLFTGKCFISGSLYYFKKDKFHREDGPAIECVDGRKEWWINNKRHREDGPAMEYPDGAKYWFKNNKYHREDGPAIELSTSKKEWYINGKLHRVDGPAVEYANGDKFWYKNGKPHREDGPAFEYKDGSKLWYINGKIYTETEFNKKVKVLLKKSGEKIDSFSNLSEVPPKYTGKCIINNAITYYKNRLLHREDGPAIESSDGAKLWRINGLLHRVDGPAVERANGHKEWWVNGKNHREDGPAIEHPNGNKSWYLNNERHREDGPACEYSNGCKEWWLKGEKYTEEEFNEKLSASKLESFSSLEEIPEKYTGKFKVSDCIYYYKDGKPHRQDGPAIEYSNGTKNWYQNGQLHRTDGPAVEFSDDMDGWFFIKDKHYTKSQFDEFKKSYDVSFDALKEESKVNMSVKSTKQLVINSAKESTYRIAAEQISQTVRAALTLALSQVSSLETANMILSTDAGKALIQASLSLALNQINVENKHLEKISYELLVSSISTGEGFILDKIIGEVMSTVNSSINSIAPLPVATRIAQPAFAQEEEEAFSEAQAAYA